MSVSTSNSLSGHKLMSIRSSKSFSGGHKFRLEGHQFVSI